MSKLLDNINHELLYESSPKYPKEKLSLVEVERHVSESRITTELLYEYFIGVKIGINQYCRRSDLKQAKLNARREIKQLVYGEFFEELFVLSRLVRSAEYKEAEEKIQEILENMGYRL